MGEVLLPPGIFQQLPIKWTRQTFIQQYQWQTSWEGVFFCTSPSRLRVGTSKSSMILGCQVFVSRSRVNTAPDTGETQSTCQRWRLCKIQVFSAQCVRSRWSKIEHGNNFNREQVWNSFQNAPHPSKMLFLDTERVARRDARRAIAENWRRDCVLWRKKNFNKGCLVWRVPSVSSVVCKGGFERGDLIEVESRTSRGGVCHFPWFRIQAAEACQWFGILMSVGQFLSKEWEYVLRGFWGAAFMQVRTDIRTMALNSIPFCWSQVETKGFVMAIVVFLFFGCLLSSCDSFFWGEEWGAWKEWRKVDRVATARQQWDQRWEWWTK